MMYYMVCIFDMWDKRLIFINKKKFWIYFCFYNVVGFKVVYKGCCIIFLGEEFCVLNKSVCVNWFEYFFWDDIYSFEVINKMVVKGLFDGFLGSLYSIV